jgi:predicted DNA-binding transcriptional regulator YafY
MALLAQGAEPSVNDIAAAAEVSRRTVYMHFPTLDQLMLDATLGPSTSTRRSRGCGRTRWNTGSAS